MAWGNLTGLAIGLLAFLLIGVFHPIVIWVEYYWTDRVWPAFVVLGGIACALAVVFHHNILVSAALGITGFSFFWSILELRHQRERVEKGWFPRNPKRAGKG